MRGFPCKNTSCGLDSTMCLDHNQVTGAKVPTNPALAPVAPRADAALRLAAWRAAQRNNERAS